MRLVLVDAVLHLRFKILEKNTHSSIINFYYINQLDYFFFSARPNGLLFEKSTNTGAATKIEE